MVTAVKEASIAKYNRFNENQREKLKLLMITVYELVILVV